MMNDNIYGIMPSINSIGFNQDKSCFHCCSNHGLRIFNVEPLVQKAHYGETILGSVSTCEMVYRSNLFAIVGGGNQPKYAGNAVLIYDDMKKRPVLQFTFTQPVLSIRCRRDRLVAVLMNEVHISFPNGAQKLFSLETRPNPSGLCELSPGFNNLLVFPGTRLGSVKIVDLATTTKESTSSAKVIIAHLGEIACIAINQGGNLIATASDKGTLIRVWDSLKLDLVNELRRGFTTAALYSINFSLDSDLLCCSSGEGVIHIFDIKNSNLNLPSTIPRLMGFLGKYVESQWAFATITVDPQCTCICAFASSNSVVVICMDGTVQKYIFNSEGQTSRLSFDLFLDACDDDDM